MYVRMYGMVWYGMVWSGLVWSGLGWAGLVWSGMVWYGMYVCMYRVMSLYILYKNISYIHN